MLISEYKLSINHFGPSSWKNTIWLNLATIVTFPSPKIYSKNKKSKFCIRFESVAIIKKSFRIQSSQLIKAY